MALLVCHHVSAKQMIELASDLHLLESSPRFGFNVYLVGDVLLDAATRFHARAILRQLRGHTVTAHALSHVHPDHQGGSSIICRTLNLPLWCSTAGISAMESGDLSSQIPPTFMARLMNRTLAGPGYPVARGLSEGDEVAGFTVLNVPGHAPSQIALWRERDRVLLLGDVLNHMDVMRQRVVLREPPAIYTPDPARNRQSARRLASLCPNLVCFGHGPPLNDGAAFIRFVETLEDAA